MKSAFYEYNVAMSGLFTAQANLNVVSHNVANAAMPGYSRQLTLQKASQPLGFGNGRGMYGTGSEVYGIIQVRDKYLDRKYWQQKGILGEYAAKSPHLSLIENVFNDLSDTGVRSGFVDYFSRMQDLSKPEAVPDATYRTNVLSAAESLSQLVRNNAEALQKQQIDINQEIAGIVQRINSFGTQIASLNKQITQYEGDGSTANDLRDQRALLVDQLSELVNVQVEEVDYSTSNTPYDKRFTVMINGYDFVNHTTIHSLACVPRDFPPSVQTTGGILLPPNGVANEKRNLMDVPGLYDIYFGDIGAKFDIYSGTLQGTLKGLIDVRDGNNSLSTVTDANGVPYQTTNYKGIPFYMNKLNTLVRTFSRAVNEGLDVNGDPIQGVIGHVNGYDYNGNPGQLFFSYTGNTDDYALNYQDLNCLNFIVNPNLTEDDGWQLVACSSDPYNGEAYNDVILGFNKINTYPSLFKEGKLIDFIIGTTDHLAIDHMQAMNFEESYTEITMATDNQRLSVAGVDLNEEMMAMVKYNQLYQACAKLVNVINGVYDTLINTLGV